MGKGLTKMIEQGMLWQAGRQAGRQDRSTPFLYFQIRRVSLVEWIPRAGCAFLCCGNLLNI